MDPVSEVERTHVLIQNARHTFLTLFYVEGPRLGKEAKRVPGFQL